jgi:PilZ domain
VDRALTDRRGEPRLEAEALTVADATLRPGCPVQIVDLSAGGAQVQSERPLRPGSRVHVRFATEHRAVSVAATVMRCTVWALHPEKGVLYRGALRFDERCLGLGEERPPAGYALPATRP